MAETVSVWWDTEKERLRIKNTAGEILELTYCEGVNLFRILTKSISIKNKIKLVIHGNKQYGKMIK